MAESSDDLSPWIPPLFPGAHGQMTGDEGAVQGAMLQGVLLASVWLRPMCYVCVWLSPFCVRR